MKGISYIIQFGISIFGLLFSTVISWYEGSSILENPWEWKYSTPISQMLNGEILDKSDIVQLDFFVYSAKFHPTFPLIMLITGLYLLLLIGYYLLKDNIKKFAYYLSFLSVSLLLLSYLTFSSQTTGGYIFFISSLVVSFLFLLSAVYIYFQFVKRNKSGIYK